MIRSEIKNFTMSYEKCGSAELAVPCTLFSALKKKNIYTPPKSEGEAEEFIGYFDSPLEFSSRFDMTESDVKRKYIYIRFHALDGLAEIYLNDKKIAVANSSQRIWTIDIKTYVKVGKNELKLVFIPDGDCIKAAHQFESEYGISLVDAGITGKVELLKFNNAIVDNVYLTESIDADSATIHIRLETLGNIDSVKAVATLVSGSGQIYYGGISRGQGSITVKNPLLWWPHGLGVQNLYRLSINLYGEYDIEDTKEYTIGLSSLGINDGDSGAFSVANGFRYMPMGFYYTPSDDIISCESDEKINALMSSLVKANCNTLVVSGSNGFASEKLLSACDRYGIVVWQELPHIAVGQKRDAENYRVSLTSSLHRIAYHPCLAAVVDGMGDESLGNLQLLCKNAAPSVAFINHERFMRLGVASYPAFPVDKTIGALANPNENIFSEVIDWHSGDDMDLMLLDLRREYLYPSSTSDFAYLTRLVQANRVANFARAVRVNRDLGGAAIISRLTDSHPTISDSAVDYFCRPKALINYANSFFSPLTAIPKLEDYRVSFAISNERRQAFDGVIYYRILDVDNNVVYHGSDDLSIPEGSILAFEGRDFSEIVATHEREYYLEYGLREGALSVMCGTLLFVKPKQFAFTDPGIKAQISGVGKNLTMTLRADAFAKDVEISFEGHDVILSDNYFDITSAAPIKINFVVLDDFISQFELEESLRIRCVNTISNVNKSLKKTRFEAKKEQILEKLNSDFFSYN